MSNLKVNFCGVDFENPLVLPSGIIQEIPDHIRAVKGGAGSITAKSLTVEPREGYPIPRIIRFEHGILNAVGFRNPGIKNGKLQIMQLMRSVNVPVIVSIFSTKLEEIKLLASEVAGIHPPFMELDISCPHVEDEFGKSLAMNEKTAYEATKAAKRESGKIPLLCKISANYSEIVKVAKACEEAGADGISAINSVGPGMVIDIKTKKPVLGNIRGGMSGPAIKPIAIRCVYDIFKEVKIPILGMGGVTTWQDVVEMMMAGATLVGIGSATYFKGMGIYQEIKQGLLDYMDKKGIKDLKEIVGTAH